MSSSFLKLPFKRLFSPRKELDPFVDSNIWREDVKLVILHVSQYLSCDCRSWTDSLVPRHLTRLCVHGRFGCVELYVVGRTEGESEEGQWLEIPTARERRAIERKSWYNLPPEFSLQVSSDTINLPDFDMVIENPKGLLLYFSPVFNLHMPFCSLCTKALPTSCVNLGFRLLCVTSPRVLGVA